MPGWAKLEEADENTLSEWIKAVRSLVKSRINKLQVPKSVFSAPDVVSELSSLHDNYMVVPADKASNNIVISIRHKVTLHTHAPILDNNLSVLTSYGIKCLKEDIDLPILYWIPKLHKNPYKQRYIAGPARCSTEPLSTVLTKVLTSVKDGLQRFLRNYLMYCVKENQLHPAYLSFPLFVNFSFSPIEFSVT